LVYENTPSTHTHDHASSPLPVASTTTLPEEVRHNLKHHLKHHLRATNKHLYNPRPHHQGGVGPASPSRRREDKHHHLTSAPVARTQHAPDPTMSLPPWPSIAGADDTSRTSRCRRRRCPSRSQTLLMKPPKTVATIYACVCRAPSYTRIREAAAANFLRRPPSLPPDTTAQPHHRSPVSPQIRPPPCRIHGPQALPPQEVVRDGEQPRESGGRAPRSARE
jgi:hypothetical protein